MWKNTCILQCHFEAKENFSLLFFILFQNWLFLEKKLPGISKYYHFVGLVKFAANNDKLGPSYLIFNYFQKRVQPLVSK